MIVPVSAASFFDALRMGSEIFFSLKAILSKKGLSPSVGDEEVVPQLKCNHEALELLMLAIESAGYKPGRDVMIALDAVRQAFIATDFIILNPASSLRSP